MRRCCHGFTLAELLVSIAVLSLLVLVASRMINSVATVATLGSKRMDADSQVRPVLDRIAVDLTQMIKRSDVDYYFKGSDTMQGSGTVGLNDRMAFYSQAQGYFPSPSPGSQGPVSLIAYRVNAKTTSGSFCKMERMSKGLFWSTVSPIPTPSPSPSKLFMIFGAPPTLPNNWPSAATGDPASPSYQDRDFELIGPQIFRFEYFYLLTDGTTTDGVPPHPPVTAAFENVAAVSVTVAAIDSTSRLLLTDCQLGGDIACGAPYANSGLIQRLKDCDTTAAPSDLTAIWQAALDGVTDMPRAAVSAIRIYQRYVYLSPVK